jgi:hypothetical protein
MDNLLLHAYNIKKKEGDDFSDLRNVHPKKSSKSSILINNIDSVSKGKSLLRQNLHLLFRLPVFRLRKSEIG